MTHAEDVRAAADRASVTIQAIADELADDFPDRINGRRAYLRRQALRLREALEALEAECSLWAAGACEHRFGDEHGNPYCNRDGVKL